MSNMPSYEKLLQLYMDVAQLTLDHDVNDDMAYVSPAKLGEALEKVDQDWVTNFTKGTS